MLKPAHVAKKPLQSCSFFSSSSLILRSSLPSTRSILMQVEADILAFNLRSFRFSASWAANLGLLLVSWLCPILLFHGLHGPVRKQRLQPDHQNTHCPSSSMMLATAIWIWFLTQVQSRKIQKTTQSFSDERSFSWHPAHHSGIYELKPQCHFGSTHRNRAHPSLAVAQVTPARWLNWINCPHNMSNQSVHSSCRPHRSWTASS